MSLVRVALGVVNAAPILVNNVFIEANAPSGSSAATRAYSIRSCLDSFRTSCFKMCRMLGIRSDVSTGSDYLTICNELLDLNYTFVSG